MKKLENTNRYQTTGTPTHFSWWCTNYLENSVSTQLNMCFFDTDFHS